MTSPLFQDTPEHNLLSLLFKRILMDNLRDITYDAEITGLDSSLDLQNDAFIVNMAGFNEKMPELLHTILEYIRDFSVNLDFFNLLKAEVRKLYCNIYLRNIQY